MKLLKKYRAMVLYIIDIIIINSSYIISSCLRKPNDKFAILKYVLQYSSNFFICVSNYF